jgi:hypothetical protein
MDWPKVSQTRFLMQSSTDRGHEPLEEAVVAVRPVDGDLHPGMGQPRYHEVHKVGKKGRDVDPFVAQEAVDALDLVLGRAGEFPVDAGLGRYDQANQQIGESVAVPLIAEDRGEGIEGPHLQLLHQWVRQLIRTASLLWLIEFAKGRRHTCKSFGQYA